MKLREITAYTNEDGSQIRLVAGRVSTHDDPEAQTEWIAFQVEVDLPTVANGAILRQKVLEQVRGKLDQPIADYRRLADQSRS